MNWMLDDGYWMLASQITFLTSEFNKTLLCHLSSDRCILCRGVKNFNLLTDSAKKYTESLLKTLLIIIYRVLRFLLFNPQNSTVKR